MATSIKVLPVVINEPGDEVRSEHDRVTAAGLPVWVEGETTCCYSVQDKFWVEGGAHKFEVYTVLSDGVTNAAKSAEVCCAPQPVAFK